MIVLCEAFTEYEYELIVLALYHQGVKFDVVGVDQREVTGMLDMSVDLDRTLAEIDPGEYSALVLPGFANAILKGNGELVPVDHAAVVSNEDVLDAVRLFHEDGKLLASICAGTRLLGAAGVLAGHSIATEGEPPTGAIKIGKLAVQDGNIITGLGLRPFHFCALLVEALVGENGASSAYNTIQVPKGSVSPVIISAWNNQRLVAHDTVLQLAEL